MGYNIQNTGRQGEDVLSGVGPKKGAFNFEKPTFFSILSEENIVSVVDANGKKMKIDYTQKNQPVHINAPNFFCIYSGSNTMHDFCVPVKLPDGTQRLWNLRYQDWCRCFG
jgi:hypothetical protein